MDGSTTINAKRVYVTDNGDIYVSDAGNHRIMKWAQGADEGELIAGGNNQGSNLNQLHDPHKLVVHSSGIMLPIDLITVSNLQQILMMEL